MTETARLLAFPTPERHVLVVGAGALATRRVDDLARARTAVTVCAPSLSDGMFDLLVEHRIRWERRWPTPADLVDAWLVHVVSGRPEVDARVRTWVEERRAHAS